MTHQEALTVLARVKPGSDTELKTVLDEVGRNRRDFDALPFAKLDKIHYARWVLFDAIDDLEGRPIPATLMYVADVDAPLDDHIAQLASLMDDTLDQVYQHCEDYPEASGRTPESRERYLRAKTIPDATVYVNTVGLPRQQIRDEARLREAIEGFLDRGPVDGGWDSMAPRQVRQAIQDFVSGDPDLDWAMQPPAEPDPTWRGLQQLEKYFLPILFLILVVITLPILIPVLIAWVIVLRQKEESDIADDSKPTNKKVVGLAAIEDHSLQNQFSALGFIKPGWFRRTTGVVLLVFSHWGTKHLFNRANLAGVKTIHFARWTFIDDKRRMLFTSNYDGSLENYMGDFIDKVAWGLNAVFSNGVGYPKTRFLFLDGAKDEGAFKAHIRNRQVPSQVWYSAYPNLSALNIENNRLIREGLRGELSGAALDEWLRRF